LGYDSEVLVVDVPRRVFELRVIEYVEKFQAELESVIFMNYGSLQYAEIGVVESRTVEKPPVSCAKCSESGVGANAPGRK